MPWLSQRPQFKRDNNFLSALAGKICAIFYPKKRHFLHRSGERKNHGFLAYKRAENLKKAGLISS
jgi:hypothetical protein